MAKPAVVEIPPAIAEFLREIAPLGNDKLCLRPLTPEESAEESARLRAEMILTDAVGAIVLVDPGNSDWYCYISKGLQAGTVFQFDHDGYIGPAFPSLKAFSAALRKAVKRNASIDELPHAPLKPLDDQVELAASLVAWVGQAPSSTDENRLGELEMKVITHLPRLDPDDVDTLGVVAASSDYYMREAAADFMAAHPRRAYIPLARKLAVDSYTQVWRPARAMLTALRAKQPPWTEEQEEENTGDERGETGLLFTLVRRANGKLRITVDEVERKGRGAALTWRPYDAFGHYDFTPEQLEDRRQGEATVKARCEEIGSTILGRLALQPELRAPRKRRSKPRA